VFFLLRKWLKNLVNGVVSTHGVVGIILGQLGALEPWREVERPEGLCVVKGDPILWVV